MAKILEKDSVSKRPTNLAPIASRFTLNTISETSMGIKLDAMDEADEYREQVYGLGSLILERFLKPWLHDKNLYQWSILRRKMDEILKPVHAFTRNVINKRRQANSSVTAEQKTVDNEDDGM